MNWLAGQLQATATDSSFFFYLFFFLTIIALTSLHSFQICNWWNWLRLTSQSPGAPAQVSFLETLK